MKEGFFVGLFVIGFFIFWALFVFWALGNVEGQDKCLCGQATRSWCEKYIKPEAYGEWKTRSYCVGHQ